MEGGRWEMLFKTIVARGLIFSSKFTRKVLAAGLRPDPLGTLSATLSLMAVGVAASRPGGAASRSRLIVSTSRLYRKLHLWLTDCIIELQ